MGNIVRKKYLDKLSFFQDKNFIKMLTGVRRCGKSTLMLQFQDLLKTETPDVSMLSINLDVPEFRFLAEKSWKELYDYIVSSLNTDKMSYVFLDEIQNVREFEKLLEGLFVHPKIDLYVTGSNAYLLSSELATLLTGRAIEIEVLPFSFAEYLEFTDKQSNLDQAFTDYIMIGGLPEADRLSVANNNYAFEYLQTVYRNIYHNDILKRHTIQSDKSYDEVVHFLIDSLGSQVSAGNIAKVLTANGKKIGNKSVSKYIDTLVEAYLFYKVERYDIKGKQHLATLEKYYLVDTGLRHALLGKELNSDSGHVLENVIFLELLRRGHRVWVGKVGNSEVDFVARDENGYKKYIQVAQTVKDPQTLARELAPFDKIPDHNEKILITTDHETGSRNGIKQINAIDWLLNQ
ncbi:MAG: ATP-binding protein [Planctomycetaceae bacterium]|jgi:predicted AAA+ superfamily ATPase|nr:ATP-binding protein [Planctomycetaceae bacterium]